MKCVHCESTEDVREIEETDIPMCKNCTDRGIFELICMKEMETRLELKFLTLKKANGEIPSLDETRDFFLTVGAVDTGIKTLREIMLSV